MAKISLAKLSAAKISAAKVSAAKIKIMRQLQRAFRCGKSRVYRVKPLLSAY